MKVDFTADTGKKRLSFFADHIKVFHWMNNRYRYLCKLWYDMTFIEPMHCNKPKIISSVEDLVTDAGKSGPSFLTDHIKVCYRKNNRYRYMWKLISQLKLARRDYAPSLIITDRITDIDSCVSRDMAFIKPMHCNKPNITYLWQYFCPVEDFTTEANK